MEIFKLYASKGFSMISVEKVWSKQVRRLWTVCHRRLLKNDESSMCDLILMWLIVSFLVHHFKVLIIPVIL